ncbi:MAG: hypothetical protein EOO67_17740 [Microbacterium sp.]|nr:MAG: hypothetical protein EOO67_17740 [Microbacterium sp.]
MTAPRCAHCDADVLGITQVNDLVGGEYVPTGFRVEPCGHAVTVGEAGEIGLALMTARAAAVDLEHEVVVATPETVEQFAQLARQWLTDCVEGLAQRALDGLAAADPLPATSLSRHSGAFGEPGALWGQVIVLPADRKRQGSLYAWSERAYLRLLDRLDEHPREVRIEFSSLDAHGSPGELDAWRFAVHRDEPLAEGRTRLVATHHFRPDAPDRDQRAAEWDAFAAAHPQVD